MFQNNETTKFLCLIGYSGSAKRLSYDPRGRRWVFIAAPRGQMTKYTNSFLYKIVYASLGGQQY